MSFPPLSRFKTLSPRIRMAWLAWLAVSILFFFPACATAGIPSPKALYNEAEACRDDLSGSVVARADRGRWLACVEGFEKVYEADPKSDWAAAGLYAAAGLSLDLNRALGEPADLARALTDYGRVSSEFPKSAYAAKARKAVQEISLKTSLKKRTRTAAADASPVGPPPAREAKAAPSPACVEMPYESAPAQAGPVTVTGIRFWSNPSYTRIVIDATGDAAFTRNQLPANAAAKKPPRLYFDLSKARLAKSVSQVVPVNDDLLIAVRAAQNNADTVRVVVDIKSMSTFKVFALSNPFRLVIDVLGEKETARAEPGPKPAKKPAGKKSAAKAPKAGDLARQLALGVHTIIIDAGHGGKDPGAPGALKGVEEKDVVLEIATRLAKKLRQKTGCKVILTRSGDKFLALEERTAQANTRRADLFISIHANSACNGAACGVETYFLNLATDEEAIQVAARENATSQKSIGDLQGILKDLLRNAKVEESGRLARRVQDGVVAALSGKYKAVNDKGVKQAPFYVLLGAQMPSILVETGFLSNEEECRRLTDPDYQDALCDGIVAGVLGYMEDLKPEVSGRR